jgi:hypothetical protein
MAAMSPTDKAKAIRFIFRVMEADKKRNRDVGLRNFWAHLWNCCFRSSRAEGR